MPPRKAAAAKPDAKPAQPRKKSAPRAAAAAAAAAEEEGEEEEEEEEGEEGAGLVSDAFWAAAEARFTATRAAGGVASTAWEAEAGDEEGFTITAKGGAQKKGKAGGAGKQKRTAAAGEKVATKETQPAPKKRRSKE